MIKKHSTKGFTLIEVLLVVALIGLLATLALAGLERARLKGRNAKRQADIKQLRLALELHYDEHGSYTQPEGMCSDTSFGGLGDCGDSGGSGDCVPRTPSVPLPSLEAWLPQTVQY